MKRSDGTFANHQGPIVSEPDEEDLSIQNTDFGFGLFSNFTNFHKRFEKYFENLEKNIQSGNGGFQEVRSYSSYVEYKDGKIVKKDEKGVHYFNDNGKGFIKRIQGSPDKKDEIKKDFDFRSIKN